MKEYTFEFFVFILNPKARKLKFTQKSKNGIVISSIIKKHNYIKNS